MTDFIETPVKQPKTSKIETPKRTKKMKKAETPAAEKQPASIKLSTIWKTLVYTFAVVGVILTVTSVNGFVDNMVDSRAEAKAQQILKAQPAPVEATTSSKANQ
jgi:hypothetical protein